MARAARNTTKDIESLKHREARRKLIPTTELEFRAVALVGCDAQHLPLKSALARADGKDAGWSAVKVASSNVARPDPGTGDAGKAASSAATPG
jgi:hypothetical protein